MLSIRRFVSKYIISLLFCNGYIFSWEIKIHSISIPQLKESYSIEEGKAGRSLFSLKIETRITFGDTIISSFKSTDIQYYEACAQFKFDITNEVAVLILAMEADFENPDMRLCKATIELCVRLYGQVPLLTPDCAADNSYSLTLRISDVVW